MIVPFFSSSCAKESNSTTSYCRSREITVTLAEERYESIRSARPLDAISGFTRLENSSSLASASERELSVCAAAGDSQQSHGG